jgi:hypothetical protein
VVLVPNRQSDANLVYKNISYTSLNGFWSLVVHALSKRERENDELVFV